MRVCVRLAAALGLLSMSGAALGQVQATCVTDSEARSLFTYMLPEALNGAMTSCKPVLAANTYLVSQGPAMIARYRAAAASHWPSARAAFFKIGMDGKADKDVAEVLGKMPDSALRPFVDQAMAGFVGKDVKQSQCPAIDRLAAAMAPFSPEATAELIAALMALVGGKEKEELMLC